MLWACHRKGYERGGNVWSYCSERQRHPSFSSGDLLGYARTVP
jgi:hypothetical protein